MSGEIERNSEVYVEAEVPRIRSAAEIIAESSPGLFKLLVGNIGSQAVAAAEPFETLPESSSGHSGYEDSASGLTDTEPDIVLDEVVVVSRAAEDVPTPEPIETVPRWRSHRPTEYVVRPLVVSKTRIVVPPPSDVPAFRPAAKGESLRTESERVAARAASFEGIRVSVTDALSKLNPDSKADNIMKWVLVGGRGEELCQTASLALLQSAVQKLLEIQNLTSLDPSLTSRLKYLSASWQLRTDSLKDSQVVDAVRVANMQAPLLLSQFIQSRQGWMRKGNCIGVDPELFFPEHGASTYEAKEVCRGCVVKTDCLEYALANGEKFGIWGGLSERERRKVRRSRSLARRAASQAVSIEVDDTDDTDVDDEAV